jgi:hypothetical protein
MKRAIKIVGPNKVLELEKVVEINIPKKVLFIEELNNGKFRLVYSKSLINDFRDVQCFSIIRED